MKTAIKILLIIATVAMTSCGNNKNNSNKDLLPADIVNNPNTAGTTPLEQKIPILTFEKLEHDFGKLIQGEKVSVPFNFTNTGKADLVIFKVSSSCGCTVPTYPKDPIKPGETKSIEVKFDTENRKGIQNKTVTILSNSQPSDIVLRIKSEVIVPEEN